MRNDPHDQSLNGVPCERSRAAEPSNNRPFRNSASPSHVVIGAGAQLRGDITNCTQLEIHGYAEGEFSAEKVIICEGGELHGTVNATEAVVLGVLDGTVDVDNKLDVRETGAVSGDVTYRELSVEAGGSMKGNLSLKQDHSDAPTEEKRAQPALSNAGENAVPQSVAKTNEINSVRPLMRLLGEGNGTTATEAATKVR